MPVEQKGTEVLVGKFGKIGALAVEVFHQVLFLAGQEERQRFLDRVHVQPLDQLQAELGVVEVAVSELRQARRQDFAVVTQQREVIVTAVAGKEHVGPIVDTMGGQQVGELQAAAGKAAEDFLLGVEKLCPGAIVGEPEADESVVNQALEIGRNRLLELIDRQVGGVVDTGQGAIVLGRLLLFGLIVVELEDEKRFTGKGPQEIAENAGDAVGAAKGGQAIGIRGIFQEGINVAFPLLFVCAPAHRGPGTNPERVICKSLQRS